jgi:hypothetical protein
VPVNLTPASASWINAVSTVDCATDAVRSSRTLVVKPFSTASSAVARTQWSVAMPTTSTSDTSWARSQSASDVPSGADPSKPEYAAACAPF